MSAHADDLAKFIQQASASGNTLLFAGAGISCRAGLPDWPAFIETLAITCEKWGDRTSAAAIRDRAQRSNLVGAASVYKTSDVIPEGERWKGLAAPFERDLSEAEIGRLDALVRLPFCAIVTTNYDSALHKAVAKTGRWCPGVERGDGSLGTASSRRDFFLARIHGRSDLPMTMVVDASDYKKLESDSPYLDFVLHVLRDRACLFLGFSFLDPAIEHVLSVYESKCGPAFSSLHRAVIPDGDERLASRLRNLNVAVIQYSPGSAHEELWRAVRVAVDSLAIPASLGRNRPQAVPLPSPATYRLMAFAYSQIQARREGVQEALTSVVQDGIVLSILPPPRERPIREEDLVLGFASALALSRGEAAEAVQNSLVRLRARGSVVPSEGGYALTRQLDHTLDDALATLAQSVADRVRVREGAALSSQAKEALAGVIERILLTRAWDVTAHYAGADCGWAPDLRRVVATTTADAGAAIADANIAGVERSVWDMLSSPDKREASLLARLSKAAFGLQLVLSTPRQALFQRYSLPERVYLDASVLMPAITDGHPLGPAYVDCLKRLRDATLRTGATLDVIVGKQFLNEIIHHRRLSLDLVSELGLEEPDRLRNHVLFQGATNTNVFIAAYSAHVGRERRQVRFEEFLREFAPYTDESQLANHLAGFGILTRQFNGQATDAVQLRRLTQRLRTGYDRLTDASGRRRKPDVLVDHEAEQLCWLKDDQEAGRRCLFITADAQLRRVISGDDSLRSFSSSTLSHLGLVALVEVMVGTDIDERSAARLIWSCPPGDDFDALYDYFVKLALRKYEEGMGLELDEIAQRVATEAAERSRAEQRDLFSKDPAVLARQARFLDEYEEKFFQFWREAIEKREETESRERT